MGFLPETATIMQANDLAEKPLWGTCRVAVVSGSFFRNCNSHKTRRVDAAAAQP